MFIFGVLSLFNNFILEKIKYIAGGFEGGDPFGGGGNPFEGFGGFGFGGQQQGGQGGFRQVNPDEMFDMFEDMFGGAMGGSRLGYQI